MTQTVLFQPDEVQSRRLERVPLERILPSPPNYPLTLKPSVATKGVLQPVLLTPEGEMLRIVAGHRRVFSARTYGLTHVPALITDGSGEALASASAVENLSRKPNPIALLDSLRVMLSAGHTLEDIAALWSVPLPTLSAQAVLLRLPVTLSAHLGGALSLGVAGRIARLEQPYRDAVLRHVETTLGDQALKGEKLRYTHADYAQATVTRTEDLAEHLTLALERRAPQHALLELPQISPPPHEPQASQEPQDAPLSAAPLSLADFTAQLLGSIRASGHPTLSVLGALQDALQGTHTPPEAQLEAPPYVPPRRATPTGTARGSRA